MRGCVVQFIGGHVTSRNVFDFGSDTKPRNLKYDQILSFSRIWMQETKGMYD